jgi:hypothetical protein
MRNENKKSKKQTGRKNTPDHSSENKRKDISTRRGFIEEPAPGNIAEREIERTPHDKSSVTGSDYDGQAE